MRKIRKKKTSEDNNGTPPHRKTKTRCLPSASFPHELPMDRGRRRVDAACWRAEDPDPPQV